MESAPKESLLPEGYWYSPNGYLWHILPAEKFIGLPETVEIDGEVLTKKHEFHVTIVNARSIARELAGSDPKAIHDIETNLQKMLTEYLSEKPIKFLQFKDDIRLATSLERMSIAARCNMLNVEEYFDRIKLKYGRDFSVQPAHVSLYTRGDAAVGIDSTEQMESFKKVELPTVQKVLDSID